MKKASILILSLFLSLTAVFSAPQSAAGAATPKNAAYLDKANSAFVPLRSLSGLDGIVTTVKNDGSIIIARGDRTLSLVRGSMSAADASGRTFNLAKPAFASGGTTYVPLSAVSGALDIALQWGKAPVSLTLTAGGDSVTLPVQSGSLIASDTPAASSAKRTFKVGGRSFTVQMVTVSLLHPAVSLNAVLAGNTVGKTEALGSIAKRSQAQAAINGTFFDAYTKDAYKAPYGYIASGGKLLKNSPGDKRTVFVYDSNLLADLVPGGEFMDRLNSGAVTGAIQAGPRLLTNGQVALNVAAEGFKDPKILTGGGARSALGLTRDHKLILLTTGGATIPQLAQIMKQAGAYQAMNLDGGASSGLYYGGKYLTEPGRLISNALVVKTR
ncbi:phosphodiester glycosidase family protein [Paenibacillus tengchongensis]|uniref:phosphodiester glycosidase family protein n=1 Tax=Paenibacillus tengchongensis TaxID=2608684 RepID=UPI00124C402B|nr:phosphodiester glycosidase family protein [Paenibacillus tengchongensis]